MNDDERLEAQLRALRPADLPSDFLAQLEGNQPPPVTHRPLRLRVALCGGAALAIAATFFAPWHPHHPATAIALRSTPQPSDFCVFLPADRRSTLLDVREGEVVDAGEGRQVRLVRAVWFDDTTYLGDDRSILHRQTERTQIVPVALENL